MMKKQIPGIYARWGVSLKTLLFIALSFISTISYSQTRVVTGIVLDESAQPLTGASVTVKGTNLVTVTNANGRFSINVPSNRNVLVISFVGMETQEATISTTNEVSVSMRSTTAQMSDVVIIGYGTARKRDLTGAVSSLRKDELIREAPTNIVQALQGKLAGVNITQNDGAPGAGLSIRIRGSNSFLGGTEPLYVIDGIPFNNSNSNSTPAAIGADEKQTVNALSFLNPNDIESIDILKDASATAIYGSRGANGVVLITTRRGRTGKDKVEVNISASMSEVTRKLDMLNAYEYALYQNLAYTNANKYAGANYSEDEFPYPGKVVPTPQGPSYKQGPNDYAGKSKDWQDAIFRRGFTQDYSVNISGGNEMGFHSLSLNYLKQDGIIENSGYNRYGLSFNLMRNIGKVKVGSSTSLSNSTMNGVKTGTEKSDDADAGVVRAALTYPSTVDTVLTWGESRSSGSMGNFISNPSIYVKDVLNKVTGTNVFSSNYAEVNLLKDLKFRQNLGYNYLITGRDQYYPRTIFEGFGVKGWGLKSDETYNSLISESLLTYRTDLGDNSFDAMAGFTYERVNGQSKRVEAQDFTSDLLKNENLEAGQVKMPVITDRYQSTLISMLSRINYNIKNKYIFTASIRRDGSSKFGKNNKWSNFPSAAFAWRAINEDFIANNLKALSDLKFRFSYGKTGNQGIGVYSSLSKLRPYSYPFGGSLQTGFADDYWAGPANPNLKWETTIAYNAGIDIGLFKNALNIHIDGYVKKTVDLLQYSPTPLSSGFPVQLVNAGTIRNKGIELSIEGTPLRGGELEWSTNLNVSVNRNEVVSLRENVDMQFASRISTGDQPFIQVAGSPIGTLYGYVEDGYYDNEAEVRHDQKFANYSDAQVRKMIGEIKYRDLDGDPTALTQNDRTIIGDVNPDYVLGFTNNFRYKDWDLSIFIYSVQGNDIINMNRRFMASNGDFKNITQEMYDGAWREENDNRNANGPKIWRTYERDIKFTRRFIEDGSFIRLKNVSLGYTVPSRFKGIQSIKLTLGANNLYTITDYTGYDPEINSYGDNPALYGVDLGGYPNARTYTFSVRCVF